MKALENCRLCPRRCGVNRLNGERGFCGAGREVRIARAALHFWEEPCISGSSGSGTVFFSNCTMKCVYCQNYEVSTNNLGYAVTEEELAEIFLDLQRQGANNINLVTPTHYVPQIIAALLIAGANGMVLPVVYNTGGYELPETIEMLCGYVDIYMPDFKYYDNKTAARYSKAPDYLEHTAAALDSMYHQVGTPELDQNGIMRRGMIIRHLMLPGRLSDTVHIINYIHKHFGDKVYFSLMNQYTPVRHIEGIERLNGRLDVRAYRAAVDLCRRLGMERVFVQDGEAASESFIPEFTGTKEHL
ncbi:MAG: radical SAM protein [Clostridiales bacterium]|nr:radical SAM protein [Clostridiales bacterium]